MPRKILEADVCLPQDTVQGADGDGTVHGDRNVHRAFCQSNMRALLALGRETKSLQSFHDVGSGKIARDFHA